MLVTLKQLRKAENQRPHQSTILQKLDMRRSPYDSVQSCLV